jgi:hypothetical protein
MEDAPAGGADIRGQYLFATQSPKLVAGLICTMLVIVLWVGSSELSQFIFDNADYSKPFFMTAFNTAMFSVYLLGFLFFPSWRESSGHDVLISHHDCSEDGDDAESDATAPLLIKINSSAHSEAEDVSSPHGDRDLSFPMLARDPARLAEKQSEATDAPDDAGILETDPSLPPQLTTNHAASGTARERRTYCPAHDGAGGVREVDASSSGMCSASEDALRALAMPVTLPWYQVSAAERALPHRPFRPPSPHSRAPFTSARAMLTALAAKGTLLPPPSRFLPATAVQFALYRSSTVPFAPR